MPTGKVGPRSKALLRPPNHEQGAVLIRVKLGQHPGFRDMIKIPSQRQPSALTISGRLDALAPDPALSFIPQLKSNSVSIAEKLINKGRIEGRLAGKIQILEEHLDLPVTQDAVLYELSPADLNARHAELRLAYEAGSNGRQGDHRI